MVERGWGAGWSGKNLLIAWGSVLLLAGREGEEMGLVISMRIEGRQSWIQGERAEVTTGFHQNCIKRFLNITSH